ncbi:MAG: transcriptional regulator [Bacillota bacterium]|nr:MAG: transcriptional regulator [Bacillota bacterium]MBS3950623.1 TetR/AcrR family transcriptional regulator [Peptococcaceae bacterium]
MAHQSFYNLTPERQEQIRTACVAEFASLGYSKASTNTMCREAGISKGLLFHYFGTKKELFLYLVDHLVEILLEEFYQGINQEREDLFERMLKWSLRRLELARKYPLYYRFNVKMFIEPDAVVRPEINEIIARLTQEGYNKLLDNIDYSSFRPGVDITKAIEALTYVLNGIGEKYLERFRVDEDYQLKRGDAMLKEIHEYMDILRYGFYTK